jgi:hypothetical protein
MDEVHRDVLPALKIACFQDPNDMRVLQLGRGVAFANEPGRILAPDRTAQQFQGDKTVLVMVPGAEDVCAAPRPDGFD